MHIEHLAVQLQRRSTECGWPYLLGKPASDRAILDAESRLGVQFPEQVKVFYRGYDGLLAGAPPLIVHSLQNLRFMSLNHLAFAAVSGHDLCFDVSHRNEAEQWDIVSSETGYRVTLTMASFWSNKLWAWLLKRRPIWTDEFDGRLVESERYGNPR